MKYYLDEDLSSKISKIIKKQGIDCISSHKTKMNQTSDFEQLTFAAKEGRCFVTKNRNDFIQLTIRFFNQDLPHHGVLIIPTSIPGDKFSLIAKRLIKYAVKHPAGMQPYTIDFLS